MHQYYKGLPDTICSAIQPTAGLEGSYVLSMLFMRHYKMVTVRWKKMKYSSVEWLTLAPQLLLFALRVGPFLLCLQDARWLVI